MQRWRGNLSEIKILFQYLKNISISRFHEQFLRNSQKFGYLRLSEKILNSYNVDVLYIILNHLTWRFAIYHLFGEILGENYHIQQCRNLPKFLKKNIYFNH